jgi:hypothetical protein
MRSWYVSKNLRAVRVDVRAPMRAPKPTVMLGEAVERPPARARFSASPDMEERARVFGAGVDAIARLHDVAEARKSRRRTSSGGCESHRTACSPRRWEEEGLGSPDEDRQLVRSAGLPHRVEARVVHLDQRPLADPLAQIQPRVFRT